MNVHDLFRSLDRKPVMQAAFLLNILVAAVLMWSTRGITLADANSYLMLAEGILQGQHSLWWPLGPEYPDTTRTPGFPLYIATVLLLAGEGSIGWIQLVMYAASMLLTMKVIQRLDPRIASRSIFLLLLLPMVNVPYYISQFYPEIPALTALSAALFIVVRPGPMGWGRAIALGALYGFIFQCRPVFLLFPLLMVFLAPIVEGGYRWKEHSMAALVFVITLLPYGFWNLKHHGVFKVTPLESGGGIAHMGYWAGKIPGYTEKFYWGNFTGDEIIRFTPADSIPGNIQRYEQEWEQIRSSVAPLLTARDTVMMGSHHLMHRPVLSTYNSTYTRERERLLNKLTIENVKADPVYVFLFKCYSAVRLWVIGIQRGEYLQASGMGRLKILLPTAYTGLIFLLAVIFIPMAYHRRQLSLRSTYVLPALLLYFGIIHIPFVIQARYTTPVRFVMLAMIALAISALLRSRDRHGVSDRSFDPVQ